MAMPIRTVPILTGKQAKNFLKFANRNEAERAGTLDFSKQFRTLDKILANSDIK